MTGLSELTTKASRRFFVLHEGFYPGVQERLDQLSEAAIARGIEPLVLDSLKMCFEDVPKPRRGDLLYNCARGSTFLESRLLREGLATFYRQVPLIIAEETTVYCSIVHEKAGLPAPRTAYNLPTDRAALKRRVESVGGFPVVIKSAIGTRGIGTLRVESWQALVSLADHLATLPGKYIIREFIDAAYGMRAMVLGNEVFAALRFEIPDDDFRNAAGPDPCIYTPIELTEAQTQLCVQAAHAVNREMGGVDLLIDHEGKAFLLEINMPTGFQALAGSPWFIQNAWVDYLVAKSNAIVTLC
ncbi:MAG: hypothetical protein CMP06_01750 [Xanthomonadales bacterium]|nr:hypothetical protein [Xanthomonadales bacterium]